MIRAYIDDDLDELLGVWYSASVSAHSFLTEEFLATERRQIVERWLPISETIVYDTGGRTPGGRVVGFLPLIGTEVGGICVDPNYQRRGISRALLDAARVTHPVLELSVFEANAIGRRFYETYGFEPVDRRINEETGHPELRLRFEPDDLNRPAADR